MNTTTLYLTGMHCNACKLLVEKALIQLPAIQAVDANVRKGQVRLQYEGQLDLKKIHTLTRELGYEVVDAPVVRPRLSKNVKDYQIALISLISFLLLYFIFRKTWLFSGEITSTSSPSLWLVLLIGLTAGFSSCMAVVGGLVLAISSKRNQNHTGQSFGARIVPHFRFNAGRILGFAVLGGILGVIGQAISLSPFAMSVMMFAVGGVMLLLGVSLSQLFPKVDALSTTPPALRATSVRTNPPRYRSTPFSGGTMFRSFISGILTFFLPCGFTFAMQLYAMSTGSFRMGAVVMVLFAVGTLPWLLGVGSLTSVFKGKIAKVAYQAIGMLVILLGVYNMATAYGVIKTTLAAPSSVGCEEGANCSVGGEDVQVGEIIQMTYSKSWLSPSEVRLEVGKTYTLHIDVQTTVYGCMSTIYLPGLDNKLQSLEAGKPVTFTVSPTKAGSYEFDCAMGVSHGARVVVENPVPENPEVIVDVARIFKIPDNGEILTTPDGDFAVMIGWRATAFYLPKDIKEYQEYYDLLTAERERNILRLTIGEHTDKGRPVIKIELPDEESPEYLKAKKRWEDALADT